VTLTLVCEVLSSWERTGESFSSAHSARLSVTSASGVGVCGREAERAERHLGRLGAAAETDRSVSKRLRET